VKSLTFAFALALLAAAGCAQLTDGTAHAGATSSADDSPYPKLYPNPGYHVP